MRIDGEWYVCEDDVVRPVVRCEVQGGDGVWRAVPFLVDTGADRTVFSRVFAKLLGASTTEGPVMGGLGGFVETNLVGTAIRCRTSVGTYARFNGDYPAALDEESLDMSVLGRDILGYFATIVDYPKRLVCLLSQSHDYQIIGS
jgi:hypothetical protein